jgi:hypothetical protein
MVSVTDPYGRILGFLDRLSAIHKLINSVWNKEELPDQWKESVIVPTNQLRDFSPQTNYTD